MKYYTYIHYRCDTNQPFYIGKGVGNRAYSVRDRNTYWKNIVNKCGYKVEILSRFGTDKEACLHEIFLIQLFKELGFKLCNIAPGGNGGAVNTGRKYTEEHKRKIGLANRKNHKYRIIGTNLETGDTIELLGEVSVREAGFDWGHVWKCCVGKRKTHKGFAFRRELIND